jgi:diguanylate cyclase (GGDEF)-like protein
MLRAKRYDRPFTLAYIDLDNFKQINDKFGHSVGDEVLKLVAATIQSNLRQTDIIARLGGDEFAIFLPESNTESAKNSINKIRSLLLKSMEENKWEVTFSIGVITFHEFSYTLDEVIQKADNLMYSVKINGKNNIKVAIEPSP